MAIVANTFTAYDAIGIREQLADIIYNIAPTQTPFLSMCKKGKASNILFEWQKDSLDAAANNAQLEGDDVTSFSAVTPTVRVNNRTQISRKTIILSATEQAVTKAGRKDEIAYQIMLKGKALKRDMETALTQNTTAVTGSTTVARQTRGLEGWVGGTNSSLGTSGVAAAPSTNTAPTDGTQRTFTEALLKDAWQKTYTSGGNPDTLMVGPTQKQTVSTFTGNATRFDKSEDAKLYAAISVYYGDFGEIKIVPNRFQRNRTAFLLESDKFQVNYLREFQVEQLAKTGDADKRLLVCEYGLQSNEEAASAAIRDLL